MKRCNWQKNIRNKGDDAEGKNEEDGQNHHDKIQGKRRGGRKTSPRRKKKGGVKDHGDRQGYCGVVEGNWRLGQLRFCSNSFFTNRYYTSTRC